jgi:hypothetical protein
MALPPRRPFVVSVAGLLVVAAVATTVFVLARRDDNSGTADQAAAITGTTLVVAEFGTTADHIYRASAEDPSRRSLVATIDHAPEWGINPATRPAGARTAYTVLPADRPAARETPAELWLLDVATGEKTLLASDADLLTAPVFDRTGDHVVYRRNGEANQQALVSIDVGSGIARTLHSVETQFGVYPVGFASDGALLFADVSQQGTDLYRLTGGGDPQLVLHASDQVARDWEVSPDGMTISFVAPETHEERIVNRLQVVELNGTKRVSVPAAEVPATADQFSPIWRPDGEAITIGREAYPERTASAVTYPLDGSSTPESLATPVRGYDVPLSWSEDGQYLVARSYDGMTANDPGEESLVVIAPGGERRTVAAPTEVLFLGWLVARG